MEHAFYMVICIALLSWIGNSIRNRKNRKKDSIKDNARGFMKGLTTNPEDLADELAQDNPQLKRQQESKRQHERELRRDIFASQEAWDLYVDGFTQLNKSQQEYEISYIKKKIHSLPKYKNDKSARDFLDEHIRELELIYRA